jgi:hypothetical protein
MLAPVSAMANELLVVSAMVDEIVVEAGGLQESTVASKHKLWLVLSATAMVSGPPCHFHPLFAVLPFIVLAPVAASLWPSALALQVALVCFKPTL